MIATGSSESESHSSQKVITAIKYRKACFFKKSTAFYTSSCDAAASKRTNTMWLVSVVGATEQKAVEILSIMHKLFRSGSQVKLRWWSDGPPSYDCKSGSSDKWVGYDPDRGCYDVPQVEAGAEITLLYYSDGCDPRDLLETIPRGEFMMYHTYRMLTPVSDYIFDKESCKAVVCCEYSPFYKIETAGSCYYAPVPIMFLDRFREGFFQRGEVMRTLEEINDSFESFSEKRMARFKCSTW